MNESIRILLAVSLIVFTPVTSQAMLVTDKNTPPESRITNEYIPFAIDKFPKRPRPILELGDPLLGGGPISQGFTLPTGAVWQPKFQLYGQYRTGFQGFHNGNDKVVEWANRFNFFWNLDLTESERIVGQVRFLDLDGQFSGYTFHAPSEVRSSGSGWDDTLNADVTTLFFEGNLGEMFPMLDPNDSKGLDIGFLVGRTFLNFQENMLIADHIDTIGFSKLNLRPGLGIKNLRTAIVYGLNDLGRRNQFDDANAKLYGISNEFDLRSTTVQADFIYVDAEDLSGDGVYWGLSAAQRHGARWNSTFRILGSEPVGSLETDANRNGILLFAQLGMTPKRTHDYFYINLFNAINNFRSASREPRALGPLFPTGILFDIPGLGRVRPPLNTQSNDAIGGTIGYQHFWNNLRTQLIAEIGTFYANNSTGQRAVAGGLRYQKAFGRRYTLRLDAFLTYNDNQTSGASNPNDITPALRAEFQIRF